MKNRLARFLNAIRQESRSTQLLLAVTLFAFASAGILTLGQISGIFIHANIGGADYPPQTQPLERPQAPGYAVDIVPRSAEVDNIADNSDMNLGNSQIDTQEDENESWFKNLFN